MVLSEDVKDLTKVLERILHEIELVRPRSPTVTKGTWLQHFLCNLHIGSELKKELGYNYNTNRYRITKINKEKWKRGRLKINKLIKDKNKIKNITGFSRLKPDGSVEVNAYYSPQNEFSFVMTSESEVILEDAIWFFIDGVKISG